MGEVDVGVGAAGGGVGLDEFLVFADRLALDDSAVEGLQTVAALVGVGGITATAVDPQPGIGSRQLADIQIGVVTGPGRVVVGTPHVLGVEAAGIVHGQADPDMHVR